MIIGYNQEDKEKYGKIKKAKGDMILEKNADKMKKAGLFYLAPIHEAQEC